MSVNVSTFVYFRGEVVVTLRVNDKDGVLRKFAGSKLADVAKLEKTLISVHGASAVDSTDLFRLKQA